MPRPLLDEPHIHPAIRERVASYHADTVRQVQDAVARDAVVVVGMQGNPFVRRARKALQGAGIEHTYLEYGSYFSQWRVRNALKLWCGWPTLPMVFVKGVLVGGAEDLGALLASGELRRMLA